MAFDLQQNQIEPNTYRLAALQAMGQGNPKMGPQYYAEGGTIAQTIPFLDDLVYGSSPSGALAGLVIPSDMDQDEDKKLIKYKNSEFLATPKGQKLSKKVLGMADGGNLTDKEKRYYKSGTNETYTNYMNTPDFEDAEEKQKLLDYIKNLGNDISPRKNYIEYKYAEGGIPQDLMDQLASVKIYNTYNPATEMEGKTFTPPPNQSINHSAIPEMSEDQISSLLSRANELRKRQQILEILKNRPNISSEELNKLKVDQMPHFADSGFTIQNRPTQQGSGSFTDTGRYLTANAQPDEQGNSAVKKLTSSVQENLANQGQNVQNEYDIAAGNSVQGYNKQQQGLTAGQGGDYDKALETLNRASNLNYTTDWNPQDSDFNTYNQISKNTNTYAENPFETVTPEVAKYNTDLADYGNIAKNIGTDQGRVAALQNYYSSLGINPSLGGQNLDVSLFGQAPNSQQLIRDIGDRYQQAQNNINQDLSNVSSARTADISQGQTAATNLINQRNVSDQAIQDAINARVSSNANETPFLQAFQNKSLTPEQLQALGFTGLSNQTTAGTALRPGETPSISSNAPAPLNIPQNYGVNVQNYLQQLAQSGTKGTESTEKDLARLNALAQLQSGDAGGRQSFLTDEQGLPITNPDKLGGFSSAGQNAISGLQNAISGAKTSEDFMAQNPTFNTQTRQSPANNSATGNATLNTDPKGNTRIAGNIPGIDSNMFDILNAVMKDPAHIREQIGGTVAPQAQMTRLSNFAATLPKQADILKEKGYFTDMYGNFNQKAYQDRYLQDQRLSNYINMGIDRAWKAGLFT